jgi:ribonuclease HI
VLNGPAMTKPEPDLFRRSTRARLGPEASEVELFTDGACSGNPGPGGWAFLLRLGAHEREGSGHEPHTTNNRMEVLAVIRGLQSLKRPCRVRLTSDSQYVVRAISEWMEGWKAKGWRRNGGPKGELVNADLWRELDGLLAVHDVRAQWVRGHVGHEENERVDALAQAEASRAG